jgi:hypothetical protein
MTVSGSSAPLARRQQLIINETTQHIIVYDERSNHIHQLNATSAAVWRHCDGLHSVTDLQRLVSLDLGERVPMGSITLALAQLSDANLLEIPWVAASPPQRQSRRSLLRKTVITGADRGPDADFHQRAARRCCPVLCQRSVKLSGHLLCRRPMQCPRGLLWPGVSSMRIHLLSRGAGVQRRKRLLPGWHYSMRVRIMLRLQSSLCH